MIVLLESVHPDARAILAAHEAVVDAPTPTDLPDVEPDSIRAIVTRGLGRVDARMMDAAPNLRVVARCGAGLDNIDLAAAAARDITVVYAPDVTAVAVAEHATLLMLALARQVVRLSDLVTSGDWQERDGYEGVELAGRRLGVVGLGAIGTRVARIGVALGMDVVGWNRSDRHVEGVTACSFDELLATSDVVQLCVALTPETTGLVDAAAFARMRSGALLVNTARGGLVDRVGLAEALTGGRLGGYGADCWDPEPPPADDLTLLGHPRVIVTPHVAALTDLTYRALCCRPADAVVAVLGGDEPDHRAVYR